MFRMQMFFSLHSEELLHHEMVSCYTSDYILYLCITKTEFRASVIIQVIIFVSKNSDRILRFHNLFQKIAFL